MKLHVVFFVMSLFIPMFSTAISWHRYHLVVDRNINVQNFKVWPRLNKARCAEKCMMENECVGFTFVSLEAEGECTIGSAVKKYDPPPFDDTSRKLYIDERICRYDLGYELRAAGTDIRCLYFSPTYTIRSDAVQACSSLGGRLAKTNTQNLIDLAMSMAEDKGYPGTTIHIGLDDIQEEDTFVWSDGTTMTTDERQLFDDGEPNNYYIQNCGAILRTAGKILDWPCLSDISYICEMGNLT